MVFRFKNKLKNQLFNTGLTVGDKKFNFET